MTFATRPPESAARDRAALETIVGAHFMLGRASRWSLRVLMAAQVPSFVLWLPARVGLPGLVIWLAQLAWVASASLAVVFAVAVLKWSRMLEAELPATRGIARVRAGRHRTQLISFLSFAFLVLAGIASGGLWLHSALPSLVPADAFSVVQQSWLGLSLAGLGLRGLEVFV